MSEEQYGNLHTDHLNQQHATEEAITAATNQEEEKSPNGPESSHPHTSATETETASSTTTDTAAEPSSSTANLPDYDESEPPEYFELAGWGGNASGPNHKFDEGLDVSRNVIAVFYEQQRWYPLTGWTVTLPTDRKMFSNGNGSRSSPSRPSFTEGSLWCIDRSNYPDYVDMEGWTYAFNFTDFPHGDVLGCASQEGNFVRRRRWMAPIPVALLREAGVENSEEESLGLQINEDIVWDLFETGTCHFEKSSGLRTFLSHVSPSDTYRRGLLVVNGKRYTCILSRLSLKLIPEDNEHKKAYSSKYEEAMAGSSHSNDGTIEFPITNIIEIYEIKGNASQGKAAGMAFELIVLDKDEIGRETYSFTGSDPLQVTAWYTDIKNVSLAKENWETAKEVGVAVAIGSLAVLAGVLLGGRRR